MSGTHGPSRSGMQILQGSHDGDSAFKALESLLVRLTSVVSSVISNSSMFIFSYSRNQLIHIIPLNNLLCAGYLYIFH